MNGSAVDERTYVEGTLLGSDGRFASTDEGGSRYPARLGWYCWRGSGSGLCILFRFVVRSASPSAS